MELNRIFDEISVKWNLPDHYDLNKRRYPWAVDLLSRPQFYASRLWEYPWAVFESGVKAGMRCADVGCGQSPFTIYLKEIGCEVVGFDPDYGTPAGWYCHGVPISFAKSTGIRFVKCGMEALECPDEFFDRVFCISVLEHIPYRRNLVAGMREIARVLKPGGLALITVDVLMFQKVVNPLDLVWESGLTFYGPIDLELPEERWGMLDNGQPCDVFGIVLSKPDKRIRIEYGNEARLIEAWRVPLKRETYRAIWPEPTLPIIVLDLYRFRLKYPKVCIGRWLKTNPGIYRLVKKLRGR
jgi:SAM-dependent methyltransferase